MAQIQGLEEQREALKRINNNLKSIEEVNSIMEGIHSLSNEEGVSASYELTITFNAENGLKRFKCPIMFDNNQHVLDAVKKYKESIVSKVKDDSMNYRISLSPEEHELLE